MDNNLDNKILENIKIVITRAENQSEEFTQKLEDLGAKVINLPLIKIEPIINEDILNKYKNITFYNWIIFTSTNSVEIFFNLFNNNNIDKKLLKKIKFAVVGKKTQKKLNEYGFKVSMIPEKFTAENLLNAFINKNITGNNILIPASSIAKKDLYNGLIKLGNHTDFLQIYNTVEIKYNDDKSDSILNSDYITFTSPSTVQSFYNIFKNKTLNSKIICIGTVTSSKVKELMNLYSIIPEEFTIDGMIKAIIKDKKTSL